METTVWPAFSNTTELHQMIITGKIPALSSLLYKIVYAIGGTMGIIGVFANAFVLLVLIRAHRQYGSHVNTLIINQSVMDFLSCFVILLMIALRWTGNFKYGMRRKVIDDVICVLFHGGALLALVNTALKIGLVVITLERYFKIVHAVAHRKHYRDWMTKVGVALPWIWATCVMFIPSLGTTRILNGTCLRLAVWPHDAMASAFSVFRFLCNYVMPMSVFAYCYARIFYTIRRQSKVVTVHAPNTSRNQNPETGQIHQQATGATTGAGLSHTELTVIKTMVAVIICFIISWTGITVMTFLTTMKIAEVDVHIFNQFMGIAHLNASVDPFIYASRYDVFKRSLKQMLGRGEISTNT